MVDLHVRDGVVAGFTLHLDYGDAAERAELERRFITAWGPTPARLRVRDIEDRTEWVIVVGSDE